MKYVGATLLQLGEIVHFIASPVITGHVFSPEIPNQINFYLTGLLLYDWDRPNLNTIIIFGDAEAAQAQPLPNYNDDVDMGFKVVGLPSANLLTLLLVRLRRLGFEFVTPVL